MIRRLFLFAAYDPTGIIDKSLIYTLGKLSEFGDIILVMDSNCPDMEIDKIRHLCMYISAYKHSEYDFGSYRRAYTYARDTNILARYNFVYFVNDSVYGPLYDLAPILEKLEHKKLDAFGIVAKPHKTHPHIQSWFIGCGPSVFLAKWFDKFITSVTKQSDKGAITHLYEQGFTKKLIENECNWGAIWQCRGRDVYNKVQKLYKSGMPFVKKASINRRHGSLGRQFSHVLTHTNPSARNAILTNIVRVYGNKYAHWLLTKNPGKIIIRNIHHGMFKIFIEGI